MAFAIAGPNVYVKSGVACWIQLHQLERSELVKKFGLPWPYKASSKEHYRFIDEAETVVDLCSTAISGNWRVVTMTESQALCFSSWLAKQGLTFEFEAGALHDKIMSPLTDI